jgi:PPM family protein phosphatase
MVQAAGFSDIGKVRKNNEDCYLLDILKGLYIVADGMGGHRGGGVASRLAVDTIAAYIGTSPPPADVHEAETGNHQSDAAEKLRQSIFLANQKVYARSVEDATCRGMGTTVSALYLVGDTIITANVGDSPIYLLRNGDIENLYTPHTLLNEQKKMPKSLADRFSGDKLSHVLTRAVGIRSDVSVDLVETPCFKSDIIVLCSDGLTGKISKEELRDLVFRQDAQSACRQLADLANQRGGEDNITVIVVRITSANEKSSSGLIRRIGGISRWLASLYSSRKRT